MTTTSTEPVYTLTLKPTPDPSDPSGARRLRNMLKVALRRFGLRCVRVVPQPGDVAEEVATSDRETACPPFVGSLENPASPEAGEQS